MIYTREILAPFTSFTPRLLYFGRLAQRILTHSRQSKRIARFSIQSIIDAQPNAIVEPDAVTELEYYCIYDSQFRVLSDEASVVGVELGDTTVVAKEHIVNKNHGVTTYSNATSEVCTVAVDQRADALLAGERNNGNGRVVQYRLSAGDVVEAYDSLQVGPVTCSARLGNLWLFGGFGQSSFGVVDTSAKKVVHRSIATAVRDIMSLAVWMSQSDSQDADAGLVVVGTGIEYFGNYTDVFDVTGLVQTHGDCELLRALAVSLRQSNEMLSSKVRTLEQRLQLQRQNQTRVRRVETMSQVLVRPQSGNQELEETVRRLKKRHARNKSEHRRTRRKLQRCAAKAKWLATQSVLLGVASPVSTVPDTVADFSASTASVEKLRTKLVRLKKRSRMLTSQNQQLQTENIELQARVRTLTGRVDQLIQARVAAICDHW